jgi:hypothetical protein
MRLSIFLLLLVGFGFLSGCAAERRQAAEIFGNMTYYRGNEHFAEPIKLIECNYTSSFFNVFYENKFVYGDFNHDGIKDAAVITNESSGGSGDWYMLNFLINDGKNFVHRSSRQLEDAVEINRIWQKKDRVFVDMYIHKQGDCAGYPTKRVKNVYEYTGSGTFGLGKDLWKNEPGYYKPQKGFVPNEATAIKIAEAVLAATYGQERVNQEKPLEAHLGMDIWTVLGTVNCPLDRKPYECGQLSIGIRQDNGEIISVSRIK